MSSLVSQKQSQNAKAVPDLQRVVHKQMVANLNEPKQLDKNIGPKIFHNNVRDE